MERPKISVCTLKSLHNSRTLSGVLVFTGYEGQQILHGKFFPSSLPFVLELADTDKHQNDFVSKARNEVEGIQTSSPFAVPIGPLIFF